MSESNTRLIKQKILVPSTRLLLAWLLLVVFPVIASIAAMDFFLAEYAHFSESSKLAEAFNKLELFKSSLVIEDFLDSRLNNLAALRDRTAGATPLDDLKHQIDEIIGGKSLLCIFFDKNRQKLQARSHRPADLQKVMIPPPALFRRQLQFLSQKPTDGNSSMSQIMSEDAEKKRIALSMQQLFKALTPITIPARGVAKNFSSSFGGDLYFFQFEFSASGAEPAGCLVVLRGQEFSEEFLKQSLRKKFPSCCVVNRAMDIVQCEKTPENLHSGIARFKDRIVITSTADQRYIRHVLHGGGVSLKSGNDRSMPFIQYHLPLTSLEHHFSALRRWMRLFAIILLGVSGLYFLNICFFGIDFSSSFKKRIMATTLLAALFPFTFFAASFHLHQQYNDFLGRINLLQHINTRLALFNSELDHYFAGLEGTLAVHLQRINLGNFMNNEAIRSLFKHIGESIPVTRLSLQRLEEIVTTEFADRSSLAASNNTNAAIESFMPLKTLELLRETAPLDRSRQDVIKLPGETLKITIIAKVLISNGAFYQMDNGRYPAWLSNFKVIDGDDPQKKVLGLVFSRFEAGPLLKTFLNESQFARTGYQEEFGNYQIKYAFFPTDKTGSSFIWNGSGHTGIAAMKKAAAGLRSETIVSANPDGTEEFIVNKLNQGFPHSAVAMARPGGSNASFRNSAIIWLGSVIYLALLLLFTGKLLDLFFVMPVIALARSAEQIARGSDSWALRLGTGDEFEALNNNFSEMVKGLQQRNMLRDYVSDDAYSDIASSGMQSLAPGGEYREATVLFAAIKDFHAITADFTPQQTVDLLNRFTTIGDGIVRQNGGSIDKIMNQTLMLVFRENDDEEESHALRAARTAISLAEAVKTSQIPGIYAGIASGTVISGKIGSYKGKLDFTVIGSPVNLAARLKSEAVDSTTGIIISGSTMRLLKGKGRVQFLRRCSLKGKAREYNIYELCDLRQI